MKRILRAVLAYALPLAFFVADPVLARPVAPVTWQPAVLNVTLFQGTSQVLPVQMTISESVGNPSIFVTPEISGLVSVSPIIAAPLAAGQSLPMRLSASAAANVPLGSYAGTVHLRSGRATLPATLKIVVNVVQPSFNQVLTDIADPSLDRVGAIEPGVRALVDELLVTLGNEVPNPDSRIWEIAAQYGGIPIGVIPQTRLYQIRFVGASLTSLAVYAANIRKLAGVRFVTANVIGNPAVTPNDSLYAGLWDSTIAAGINQYLEFIRIPEAWNKRTHADGISIAILDSGFDWAHGDLIASVRNHPSAPGYFSTRSANLTDLYSDLRNWHGTAMAGLICASGNNGFGIVGVAWGCNLDLYEVSTSTRFQKAMVQAVDAGARIVNMSFGFPRKPGAWWGDPNDTLRKGIEYSRDNADPAKREVLWVAAAGNSGIAIDYLSPASLVGDYPERIITVAGVSIPQGAAPGSPVALWSDSNFSGAARVDVAAPATVSSTLPRVCDFSGKCDDASLAPITYYDGIYSSYISNISGTSASAALVSGIAALVRAEHPLKTAVQVKACILSGATAAVVGQAPLKVVDAARAVECSISNKITFVGTGTVTQIVDAFNVLPGLLALPYGGGNDFTVEYTFDPRTPDFDPANSLRGYYYAVDSITVTIGRNSPVRFARNSANPSLGQILIFLGIFGADEYHLQLTQPIVGQSMYDLGMGGPAGSAFSTDALPATPPNLSQGSQRFFFCPNGAFVSPCGTIVGSVRSLVKR